MVKVVMASIGDHDAAVIALRDFHDPGKAASVLRAMGARGTLHAEFATALANYLDAAREAFVRAGPRPLRPGVPDHEAIRNRYKWFHDLMLQLRVGNLGTGRDRDADGKLYRELRAHREAAILLTADELKISQRAVLRAINPRKK
jgi:hypothetical protein